MWSHTHESIVIVTDTLATDMDGRPVHFQSKCWAIPHLRLAMAGTGQAKFLEQWHATLQQNVLARDITMLNNHAPTALRRVWREAVLESPELPPGAEPTSTVYHYGRDEGTGALVQYAYRSTSDFESEFRPGPTFAVKPQPEFDFAGPESIADMIALAQQLRDQDDGKPLGERVSIGGELIITIIQDNTISQAPIFRWPDYDDMWNEQNARAVALNASLAISDAPAS